MVWRWQGNGAGGVIKGVVAVGWVYGAGGGVWMAGVRVVGEVRGEVVASLLRGYSGGQGCC